MNLFVFRELLIIDKKSKADVIAGLTRNRLKNTCERLRVKPAMTRYVLFMSHIEKFNFLEVSFIFICNNFFAQSSQR
jgi:hypothetical protein